MKNIFTKLKISVFLIMVLALFNTKVYATEIKESISDNITNDNVFEYIEKYSNKDNIEKYTYNLAQPTLTNELLDYIVSEVLKANVAIDVSSYNLEFSSLDEMRLFLSKVFIYEDLYGVSTLNYTYNKQGEIYKVEELKFTYTMSKEEYAVAQEKIDKVVTDFVASVDNTWNDLEKAIFLNNYLCKKCDYAFPILDSSHYIYAALVEELPVCDGYSKAFMYLGKKIGLNSFMAVSDSMNHAWNLVEINDKYYNVDVTWNDIGENGRTTYKYFLNSDAEFKNNKEHSNWVADVTADDITFDSNTIWSNSTDTKSFSNYIVNLGDYWYILDTLSNDQIVTIDQYNLDNISSIQKTSKSYECSNKSYLPGLTTDNKYLYITTAKDMYRFKFEDNSLQRIYSILEDGIIFYSLDYFENEFKYNTFSWNTSNFQKDIEFNLTSGITINTAEKTNMLPNDEIQLTANLIPLESSSKEVVWKSSDESILSVDSFGMVKAIAPGTASITASNLTGQSDTVSFKVLSELENSIKGIELNDSSVVLYSDETKDLSGSLIKNDDTKVDGSFTWESSDETIATVDSNGKVTAKSAGECKIIAKYLDYSQECTIKVLNTITSVLLSDTSLNLKIGQNKQLSLSFTPSTNIDESIVWTSDNESAVTVDSNGKVTAVGYGKAIIKATTINGIAVSCEINVINPVTEIKFNTELVSLEVGKTYNVEATVTPMDATDKTLTWTSDNETIATVDSTGKITAIGVGKAKITATSNDGLISTSLSVGVTKRATEITLNKTSLILDKENTYNLSVNFKEGETPETISKWESSNTEIAIVDENGKVTAIEYGNAVITVTTVNNLTAECILKVKPAPSSISLDVDKWDMVMQQNKQLKVTVEGPAEADKYVVWESSNPSVASVDQSGKVIAISLGKTVISATTVNGLSAYCEISVISVPTTVSISPNNVDVNKGDTIQLEATVLPGNAIDKTLTWKSLNTNIATVDQNGLVTAVNAGTVVIQAVSVNNKVGNATINVKVYAESVLINEGSEKVSISARKANHQLNAVLTPSNSTSIITWESSDTDIVTVDQFGKITAVAPGETTVTATTDNGKVDTIKVRVYPNVSSVILNIRNIEIEPNVVYPLQYKLLPEGIENYITWTSDDESIATVDANGNVTAVSEGETIIKCIAENGVLDTCTVKVSNLIEYTTLQNYQEAYGNVIVVPLKTFSTDIINSDNFPYITDGYTVEVYKKNGDELPTSSYIPSYAQIVVKDSVGVEMKKYIVAVKGDISGNGQLKLYDAFIILRKVIKNQEFLDIENIIGDYSGNKQVKLYDAFKFLRDALRN